MTRNVQINNNLIKLVIWDVAGQSKFTSYRHLYYNDADGIMLVYDLTNPNTFNNLDKWILDAIKYTNLNTQIILLGNKNDLQDRRRVSETDGQLYSKKRNAVLFSETSAKTGINVEQAFLAITKKILTTFQELERGKPT